jgi:AraC-like DNA-binding protein
MSPEGVLPDGCAEIILNLADPFLHHSDDGRVAVQPSAMVVGPTTRPLRIAPSGVVDVVGIRLEPCGAPPLLRVPACELTDRAFTLDELAIDGREWRDRLARAGDWSSRVRLLEQALLGGIDERRSDALVEAATRMIESSGGRLTIDRLARALDVGPRRLERRFQTHVGMAPKTLCRIARFQRFLGQMRTRELGVAGAAVRCGYADQAHLIRDFRDLAGLTPGAFRASEDLLPRLFAGLPAGR